MKLISKTKILLLIIVGILFTFSPIITNWLRFNVEKIDVINVDTENLKGSKISEKIHIIGNSEWLDFKNDGHCTGSGTSSDPYVIKNLVIDGENSGSCIWIENSTVYFKIENCTLYNAGNFTVGDYSAGIYLSGVSNSQIIGNNCSSNCIGIYLNWSNSNTFSENIVNNNDLCGICLMGCDSNIISWNTAKNNTYGGISLELSHYNNIYVNVAFNNMIGIYLHSADYNTISGNVLNNNRAWGIWLMGWYNDISENTVNNNTDVGIFLEYSYYNIISKNNVFNNKIGILFTYYFEVFGCHDNTILANSVKNNRMYGIGIDFYCINNDVYRNSFNNSLNAYDNGSGNHWDNGVQGNSWSDYTGVDEDGDGIGDIPYNIKGTAGSKDYYPLMKCPVSVPVNPLEILILITISSGGAVVGVATILLIIRKRKRI